MTDVEDTVLLGQVGYLFKMIKNKSQEGKMVSSGELKCCTKSVQISALDQDDLDGLNEPQLFQL